VRYEAWTRYVAAYRGRSGFGSSTLISILEGNSFMCMRLAPSIPFCFWLPTSLFKNQAIFTTDLTFGVVRSLCAARLTASL
jgi:hypothetical protein